MFVVGGRGDEKVTQDVNKSPKIKRSSKPRGKESVSG